MSERLITLEQLEPGIYQLTLNDEANRNAMSEEMGEELVQVVAKLKAMPSSELRCLIVTGAGKAFSGGGHLEMLFNKTKIGADENRRLMEKFYEMYLSVLDVPVPVIAKINGHAIGAGLCFALACDLRIASSEAKLGANFVNLGLHPGMGATFFFPRIVGVAKANELLFGGKILSALESVAVGLVSRAVSPGELDAIVLAEARTISAAGPMAVRALKQSLAGDSRKDLQTCLEREAQCQSVDYAGSEFLEGITAAREKRAAKFV
jgi:enoyl-CoA hydratase